MGETTLLNHFAEGRRRQWAENSAARLRKPGVDLLSRSRERGDNLLNTQARISHSDSRSAKPLLTALLPALLPALLATLLATLPPAFFQSLLFPLLRPLHYPFR